VLVHFVHIAHPPTGSLASRTGRVLEAGAPSPPIGFPICNRCPTIFYLDSFCHTPLRIFNLQDILHIYSITPNPNLTFS